MSSGVCVKKLHLIKVGTFAWCSVKICIIFGVRFERRQKVDKKANLHENWNMQTLFDPYNFELYHFKVGAFFSETQCSIL